MSLGIAIHGDGIAACSCARLLHKRNFFPAVIRSARVGGPFLLLNQSTQRLLSDVFDLDQRFFAAMHPIRRRIVSWGNQPVAELPHTGVVVNEAALVEKLWSSLDPTLLDILHQTEFTIHSASSLAGAEERRFGSRVAHAAQIKLKAQAHNACFIESLPSGWLFLLPNSNTTGSLLAIGATPAEHLSRSRLVAAHIDSTINETGAFPAFPRIRFPLCASTWLACGSGAMSFDPICGEGVGNAVREAILASAVVRLRSNESVWSDYSARLLLGFLRHLDLCRGFYASAHETEWWAAELTALDQGIAWTRAQLSSFPKPRYRMVGFDLEQIC